MRSKYIITIAAACLALLGGIESHACSNILVTKGASADGSCMVSYAADSHQLYGELYFRKGGKHRNGSMRQVYDWDSNRYLGEIPEAPRTFQRLGNLNEKQLIIAETTYGGRHELAENDGILDYGSLIYIALERCSSAREAIELIAALTDEYGYASEGESFSIADKNEVWVMDLIGKGPYGKGLLWVARRVPDGYICAHANQARISTFPLDDPENCIYAPDVISFARERGWYSGEDADFSFCDTYAPLDFGAMRGCESRAWSAFNRLCDGNFTFVDENGEEVTRPAMDYIEYAMGHDASKRFPLFVKPSRKISLKDVADAMRDHFEGTPMDMRLDIGAGGNACPYRWRPMYFEVDGKSYCNERAIATQQTGFWFVGQSRSWLPDHIGAVDWFGTDDAATSYLTPIYVCSSKVPACFRHGKGDMLTYSPESAFWLCNRVANACYRMYNIMEPVVRAEIDGWENERLAGQEEIDRKAEGMPRWRAKRFLTRYSLKSAESIFERWRRLEELLLVKFIDGNVKAQRPDGSFVTNGNGSNIPDSISQPGYTDTWKRVVAREHGSVIEVK